MLNSNFPGLDRGLNAQPETLSGVEYGAEHGFAAAFAGQQGFMPENNSVPDTTLPQREPLSGIPNGNMMSAATQTTFQIQETDPTVSSSPTVEIGASPISAATPAAFPEAAIQPTSLTEATTTVAQDPVGMRDTGPSVQNLNRAVFADSFGQKQLESLQPKTATSAEKIPDNAPEYENALSFWAVPSTQSAAPSTTMPARSEPFLSSLTSQFADDAPVAPTQQPAAEQPVQTTVQAPTQFETSTPNMSTEAVQTTTGLTAYGRTVPDIQNATPLTVLPAQSASFVSSASTQLAGGIPVVPTQQPAAHQLAQTPVQTTSAPQTAVSDLSTGTTQAKTGFTVSSKSTTQTAQNAPSEAKTRHSSTQANDTQPQVQPTLAPVVNPVREITPTTVNPDAQSATPEAYDDSDARWFEALIRSGR